MLSVDQFIANKAIDQDHWLSMREQGVTATQVGKNEWRSKPFYDNRYMEFGRDAEAPLSLWVKENFEIMPNEWLIKHDSIEWALSTPDGISLDHSVISEIKTTGRDFIDWQGVPSAYVRQVQWQMFVTQTPRCLFSWMLRVENDQGLFEFGWLEPKTVWVERDNDLIEVLLEQAEYLWEEKQAGMLAATEGK